eukprot:4568073-Pleurochrysis_carterae.AAC.1
MIRVCLSAPAPASKDADAGAQQMRNACVACARPRTDESSGAQQYNSTVSAATSPPCAHLAAMREAKVSELDVPAERDEHVARLTR